MKYTSRTRPWLAALLSAAAPAFSHAAPLDIPGTISTVAFSFTLSETVEGTVKKDEATGKPLPGAAAVPDFDNEWTIVKNEKVVERGEEVVAKISTSKYSNKEFLLDLKDVGVISDIKGWAVSRVQATLDGPVVTAIGQVVEAQNGPARFYLTHKTQAPIAIDAYIGLENGGPFGAMTLNSRRIIKYNTAGATSSDVTTHTYSSKSMGYFFLDVSHEKTVDEQNFNVEKELGVSGMLTGGEKLGFYGPDKKQVLVPSACKLGPAFGFAIYDDEETEEESSYFVEGSVAVGAGVIKNVGTFPNVLQNPDSNLPD